MPITTTVYGQVISRRDVELAVLAQLRAWIPACVAEIERQAGLPPQSIDLPPDPDNSYRGGLDFLGFEVGWCPCLITVVQPLGAAEREYGNRTYRQNFEVQVAATVVGADEDTAREYADYYGAAVMMAIAQHGSLGTFPNGNPVALNTVMTGYPTTHFWDPEERRIIRSVVTFETEIDAVLVGAAGPVTPPSNPYQLPGDWPSVETVNTTTGTQALS